MKNASCLLVAAVLLLPCGCSSEYRGKGIVAATQPEQVAQPVDCAASDVALRFDGADGSFNGMSHSGTYLILTNKGQHSCRVPRRPELTFVDKKGTVIAAEVNVPQGMHPGPVMTPVLLAPGASARSGLRWVSGAVYVRSKCADVAKATVRLDSGEVAAPLHGHMCGDASVGIHFEEQWLQSK